ncbi:hypothetical protein RCL1_001199 [Eukaryota sp. TZLM3-RCL]
MLYNFAHLTKRKRKSSEISPAQRAFFTAQTLKPPTRTVPSKTTTGISRDILYLSRPSQLTAQEEPHDFRFTDSSTFIESPQDHQSPSTSFFQNSPHITSFAPSRNRIFDQRQITPPASIALQPHNPTPVSKFNLVRFFDGDEERTDSVYQDLFPGYSASIPPQISTRPQLRDRFSLLREASPSLETITTEEKPIQFFEPIEVTPLVLDNNFNSTPILTKKDQSVQVEDDVKNEVKRLQTQITQLKEDYELLESISDQKYTQLRHENNALLENIKMMEEDYLSCEQSIKMELEELEKQNNCNSEEINTQIT